MAGPVLSFGSSVDDRVVRLGPVSAAQPFADKKTIGPDGHRHGISVPDIAPQ